MADGRADQGGGAIIAALSTPCSASGLGWAMADRLTGTMSFYLYRNGDTIKTAEGDQSLAKSLHERNYDLGQYPYATLEEAQAEQKLWQARIDEVRDGNSPNRDRSVPPLNLSASGLRLFPRHVEQSGELTSSTDHRCHPCRDVPLRILCRKIVLQNRNLIIQQSVFSGLRDWVRVQKGSESMAFQLFQ